MRTYTKYIIKVITSTFSFLQFLNSWCSNNRTKNGSVLVTFLLLLEDTMTKASYKKKRERVYLGHTVSGLEFMAIIVGSMASGSHDAEAVVESLNLDPQA